MQYRQFRRVLVANRGEIAVRIIRACHEAGLEAVAIYSDADRQSLAVRLADDAFHVGPAPSAESYLRGDAILGQAVKHGCDAVHPGYGFLSENAGFAQAVVDAGLVWIGPPPAAISSMGSKTGARAIMQQAGVPLVPGTIKALDSTEEACKTAQEIGFPVMLKAAMGGGGKGMRRVDKVEDMASAWAATRSEASKSFGDDAVYIEKLIVEPRHVEIQLLADAHGGVIHLFERDCSIQRRNQKVIEEAPCSVLGDETRAAMAAAACLAARAVQYVGAGTVEFLLANDGSFYFLEMNTRLQVEHPVTEMITGIDLVQAQFRVASGEPLWLSQDEVTMRGHSIECRIYAEDVCQNFRPAPGRIFHYLEPSGPFVRVDSGVSTDSDVPIFYDPMIAKLIVWGADRAEAIRRAKRALSEFEIVGIPTSIPLFHAILTDENFMKGQVNTAFLSEKWLEETVGSGPKNLVVGLTVAAILKQQSAERQSVQTTGQRPSSAWKRSTGWTPYGGR